MIETVPGNAAPTAAPPADMDADANLRGVVIVAYVLFLISWLTGISAIIGVIIAYVKRRDATGTIWRGHFDNLIVVFWVMVAGVVIGILTWPIAIGALIAHEFFIWPWPALGTLPLFFGFVAYPLLVLWFFYRVIGGLLQAGADRAY